ncbi:TPA: hypothetical protein P1M42_000448 [Clostridioides difficile]|uniref:hypothetical protein n=1 Tax=Clostridioides difficile TaxID=1496 RepID=UPI00016C60A0|nr:hypothetical protein [Clostridioides difficile]AXU86763.1 hypothetical protein CDIF29745_01948 [Clostridioides difficile]EGT3641823.1 hypothetical protein [Clostridioides difficile]EGT4629322.1 hypothetical protein [Clostridioides difficile]EGT4674811.1 hypothetical protein [Clostridioides difficile]EGT5039706.1 hypothetical protein [Clostridioides difficile]
MKQSEHLKTEEKIFLSLCCQHDRDILTGKVDMSLQDFERITYLAMVLGYVNYTIALNEQYLDFANILSEQIDRENEILEEYPDYYIDEEIDILYQKWIDDFLSHVPADKQAYCLEQLKNNAQT